MSRHTVFDNSTVEEKLKEDTVQVGDNIEYCPANQQGWVLYRVIERDGTKALEFLCDYYSIQLD
jgi:hypothetical protein